jgi:hypothetical protein
MFYKTLIWRCHSLTSGTTPYQPLQSWQKFSNSNYGKKSTSQPSRCASQGQSTHMPRPIIQSNIRFSHAPAASEKITDNNSRSRHNQRAITSEGGHTNDAQSVTFEGAHALPQSLSPQLVPRQLLRNGHCPHGHRPGKSPLVPA